jgi:hypothetical protein
MKMLLAAAGAALLLTLSACSSADQPNVTTATSRSASATPTPTPTPTPTTMSVDEAGKYLLGTLCPVNIASQKANDALIAQNLDALHTSAKELLPSAQDAARRLDDGATIWPPAIDQKDITSLRDYYLKALGPINQLATAPDLTQANAVVFPDNTESGAAAQRMRLRLNLSADTSVGC